jgi:hypothetical protein
VGLAMGRTRSRLENPRIPRVDRPRGRRRVGQEGGDVAFLVPWSKVTEVSEEEVRISETTDSRLSLQRKAGQARHTEQMLDPRGNPSSGSTTCS